MEVAALGVQHSGTAATDATASLAPASSTDTEPMSAELERFFGSLGEAKAQLAGLRRQLDGLDELLRKFKDQFDPQAQGRVRVEIEATIAALHPDLSKCQTNLQSMQTDVDKLEAQLPPDYSGSDLRAQKTLVARLRQDATSLVEKFLELQKAHEAWHHATVKRQVEIIGGALTDEQKAAFAEDCLERGVSVFKEEVDGSLRKKQAETHRQVEAHYAGAVQVEKDISQLAKLFEEFSLLVNTQGEAIDRIEAHVSDTGPLCGRDAEPECIPLLCLKRSCGRQRSTREEV
jgi:t-SNARE complex subunit (syntaxin)